VIELYAIRHLKWLSSIDRRLRPATGKVIEISQMCPIFNVVWQSDVGSNAGSGSNEVAIWMQ